MSDIKIDARFIEELSFNAWPSLQTAYCDGWLLRFSQGYTQRANSVSAIYQSGENVDLLDRIHLCEQRYMHHSQRTVFKISPAVQPDKETLDSLLAAEGYVQSGSTSVQIADLTTFAVHQSETILIEPVLSPYWLEAYCRLKPVDIAHISTLKQMLNNILLPHGFFGLDYDHQTIALGLAVVERGFVGIYNVVTNADFRNHGFGTQLMLNMLSWAKRHGAHHAYLQVVADNQPALHLYKKLGFQEFYRYWYRVK